MTAPSALPRLRGGTVVGEHQVILAGTGERITLSHSAEDRSIFARGALTAARWGHGKKPGSMDDDVWAMTDCSLGRAYDRVRTSSLS